MVPTRKHKMPFGPLKIFDLKKNLYRRLLEYLLCKKGLLGSISQIVPKKPKKAFYKVFYIWKVPTSKMSRHGRVTKYLTVPKRPLI